MEQLPPNMHVVEATSINNFIKKFDNYYRDIDRSGLIGVYIILLLL